MLPALKISNISSKKSWSKVYTSKKKQKKNLLHLSEFKHSDFKIYLTASSDIKKKKNNDNKKSKFRKLSGINYSHT